MKILVTGGAGFIGSHLVEKLVNMENTVYVFDDLSNGKKENLKNIWKQIKFYQLDVSKITPLANFTPFKFRDFDVIYHLACHPRSMSFENPKRDIEVNIIGTLNILELARKSEARVIFSSNSGIYTTYQLPINEDTEDEPTTPYDLDKLQAENYIKLYGNVYNIPYTIFRFATVYGSRQAISDEWKPVVMEFINKLKNKLQPTIYWDGYQTRDFIHVSDIVEALLMAMHNGEANGETMILGTGKETSINQLYEEIQKQLGIFIVPLEGPRQLGDIRRMSYDCSKAERILGWEAKTTLEEGIREVLEHGDE